MRVKLPVFRVRTCMAGRPVDGVHVPMVQSVVYVVSPDRKSIPDLVTKADPVYDGANLEVLAEYKDAMDLYLVRIGTGEPQRFVSVSAEKPTLVHNALLALIPYDDPWRPLVEDEWYKVTGPIDRSKPGVY